jgi:hypothetical protein
VTEIIISTDDAPDERQRKIASLVAAVLQPDTQCCTAPDDEFGQDSRTGLRYAVCRSCGARRTPK